MLIASHGVLPDGAFLMAVVPSFACFAGVPFLDFESVRPAIPRGIQSVVGVGGWCSCSAGAASCVFSNKLQECCVVCLEACDVLGECGVR